MAAKNAVIAGDIAGVISYKNRKKGLQIRDPKIFRKDIVHYVNKDTVESYEVLVEDSHASFGSGAARGVAGAALLGGVGAIAGAASAKKKSEYLVSIVFKDGKRALCSIDDFYYKTLIELLY